MSERVNEKLPSLCRTLTKVGTALCVGLSSALLAPMAALAVLIDNGTYTTDTDTGLDWLDLTVTANTSYLSAETNNPGWRYATNAEIEAIFNTFFEPAFVDSGDGSQITTDADQLADSALFVSLFGATVGNDPYFTSLGYYADEDGILRAMGTEYESGVATLIIGPEWVNTYGGSARRAYGTYMVRVPEPSTLTLLGLGLLGIAIGRKKHISFRSQGE